MNFPYSNLPAGVIASDFHNREVCSRCQCEIDGPIYMLADAPLLEAIVCQDCAYWHREKRDEEAEGESDPRWFEVALMACYALPAMVWDWLSRMVRRVRR